MGHNALVSFAFVLPAGAATRAVATLRRRSCTCAALGGHARRGACVVHGHRLGLVQHNVRCNESPERRVCVSALLLQLWLRHLRLLALICAEAGRGGDGGARKAQGKG